VRSCCGASSATLRRRRRQRSMTSRGIAFRFLPRTKSQQKARQAQRSIVWTDISAPTRSQTAKCDCPAHAPAIPCDRSLAIVVGVMFLRKPPKLIQVASNTDRSRGRKQPPAFTIIWLAAIRRHHRAAHSPPPLTSTLTFAPRSTLMPRRIKGKSLKKMVGVAVRQYRIITS
jgi:hypothetical protein